MSWSIMYKVRLVNQDDWMAWIGGVENVNLVASVKRKHSVACVRCDVDMSIICANEYILLCTRKRLCSYTRHVQLRTEPRR